MLGLTTRDRGATDDRGRLWDCGPARRTLVRGGLLASLALGLLGLVWAGQARAYVYWANQGNGTIGKATLAGAGAAQDFITTQGAEGLAVGNGNIYWTDPSRATVGRAASSGGGVEQDFITVSPFGVPSGLAVNTANVFYTGWSQASYTNGGVTTTTFPGVIHDTNLNGTAEKQVAANINPNNSGNPRLRGLAVEGSYVYWSDFATDTIGRAPVSGAGPVEENFIVGAKEPWGVAVNGSYLYWANFGGHTIGRANLNGTGVNQNFVTGTSAVTGVAVSGEYIYWANYVWANMSGTIGRANLNGTDPNEGFILGANYPTGVALEQPVYGVCYRTLRIGGQFSAIYQDPHCLLESAPSGGTPSGRYEWVTPTAPVAFRAKTSTVTLKSAQVSIVCRRSVSQGDITGPTESTETVLYRGCASGGSSVCTTEGEPNGAIKSNLLAGALGTDEADYGGAIVTRYSGASSPYLDEFACGATKYRVTGSIAALHTCNVSTSSAEGCETFVNVPGQQELEIETNGGTPEPATLAGTARVRNATKLEIKSPDPVPLVTLNPVVTTADPPAFSGTASGSEPVTLDIYAGSTTQGPLVRSGQAAVNNGTWELTPAGGELTCQEYTAVATEPSATGGPSGESSVVRFDLEPGLCS